jgi:OPA family glycerol-3-phosphate transporter-like MFS transporter 1/2
MDSIKCYQCQCFILIWLGYSSSYFIRKPLGVVKTVLGESFRLGMSDLAWLDTSFMLPYAALQILAPGLPDKFSPRKVMFTCLICASITTFLSSLCPNYISLSMTLGLTGLFLAPVWPASSKMLSSWFPDSKLNSIFGLINTATYSGGLGGTALAATVVQYYAGHPNGKGWRMAFAYPSVFALFAGALLYTLKSPQERHIEIPGKKEKKDSGNKTFLPSLLRTTGVKELCVTMFCLKFVRFMMYLWLPLYLKKVLGYTNLQAGFLSTMFDLGGIVGSPLLGVGLDYFFPGKPLKGVTYCMILGSISVGAFILSASGGLTMNCITLLLMGATNCGPDSMLSGSISMDIGNRKADGNGASVTSLVNGIGSLGGVLEGSAVWIVWYLTGWTGVLNLVLGLTTFGAFACSRTYSAIRRSDKAEKLNHSVC